MKCYRCKKTITSAVRTFIEAKNAREKDSFRDVCHECYPVIMAEKGFVLVNGVWKHKTVSAKP